MSAASLKAHGVGALRASDRVEVTPLGALEPLLMEVVGEPKPVRQRRSVIGYTATLSKVRDSEPVTTPSVGLVPAGVDVTGPWVEATSTVTAGTDGTGPWIDDDNASALAGVDGTGPWIDG